MIQLKSYLAKIGMTQRELAKKVFPEMAKFNREYHINTICQGKGSIKIDILKKICKVLHLKASELLGF